MDRCDVRAGLGGEDREGLRRAVLSRPPETGKAEPVLAQLRELPFRLRRFGAGELIEVRGGDQTPAARETSAFRSKVDYQRCFRTPRSLP